MKKKSDMTPIGEAFHTIAQVELENRKLKAQLTEKDKQIEALKLNIQEDSVMFHKEISELKEKEKAQILAFSNMQNFYKTQIEKMKCCGNCAKHNKCITYNKFWGMAMTSNMVDYGCVANLDHYSKWQLKE